MYVHSRVDLFLSCLDTSQLGLDAKSRRIEWNKMGRNISLKISEDKFQNQHFNIRVEDKL